MVISKKGAILNKRLFACLIMAAGAGCASTPPPATGALPAESGCQTVHAGIFFDFEGAPPSRCTVTGERSFAVVIAPEHGPPINPSPWYAFRYEAAGGAPLTVRLNYVAAQHRYSPKLAQGGGIRELAAIISDDRKTATLTLPGRSGTVSAQPLLGLDHYSGTMARFAAMKGAIRLDLGKSHDGRPIEAVHFGDRNAPELIILLGRQHPPEVTGAYAFEPFAEQLIARLSADPAAARRFQILAVPLLNPDGVVRGHWRANLGGIDLNRDWGKFSQPETAAVKSWLDALPPAVKPVVMIDFHSTQRNLFYVQGGEASAAQQEFLARWLEGKENRFPDYPFTIERRDANPGSGTAKTWFHETYGIPSYTYEVADTADDIAVAQAARQMALDMVDALNP